ncbi:MAG TPA: hypothetical protein PLM83_10760, partial [Bacillota bacterium]|nr:hypothetical protein [Bacillota bacterium]
MVDAIVIKIRKGGRVWNHSALIAVGVALGSCLQIVRRKTR